MVNAYKLANFDELTDRRSRAAAQAAVNDARGLHHLAGVPGGDAAGGGLSDEELRVWQGMGFTPEKARAYHSRFTKA
nr:MAG TPA_asm: hypothetical protein [Bacteriophage sp.]